MRPPQALATSLGPPDASLLAAAWRRADRKSTRLNSSHLVISYAVFCLKKKNRSHVPHAGINPDIDLGAGGNLRDLRDDVLVAYEVLVDQAGDMDEAAFLAGLALLLAHS